MASIPCPTTSASRWPQFPAQQQVHQDGLNSLPNNKCIKMASIPCPTTSASRWTQFPAQQQEHQDGLNSLPNNKCIKMASIPCPTTRAPRWPQFPAQQQEHQDALHSLPYSCLKTPSIIKQVMTFSNGKINRNPVNLINLYIYITWTI